jgi:Uma2 family endonuclease
MATLEDHGSVDSNDPMPAVQEPLLHDGQRLDQPTFHDLYLRTPEDFRAELIDGVVHVMSSPVNPKRHGRPHATFDWFLYSYRLETPGTEVQGDSTTKLDLQSEVQPDCSLLIDPSSGGQTGEDSQLYTTGCPELVVEIASSTLHVDLNTKKRIYERAGAKEYVVYDEPHRKIHWFVTRNGRFEPLMLDGEGIYRSEAFPGLWLDPEAFLRDDGRAVMAALRRGLESPQHAEFVERLRQNRANRP